MVRFGPTELDKVMAMGKWHGAFISPNPHDHLRKRGCGPRNQEVRETNQIGIRKGVLPLLAHQQKTLCRAVLDQTRKV